MKKIFLMFAITFLVFNLKAQNKEKWEEKLDDVIDVLEEMNDLPEAENKVPGAIINEAEAIMVIPKVIKGGLVVGGRHGKGIAMIKNEAGHWGNPVFVNLSGGSIGWQIGAQSTDVILVFKRSDKLKDFKKNEFTLGADAAVAAGPVGRQVGAGTDITLEAEVYSYSKSRGVFAGISLEGSSIKLNEKANKSFYGKSLEPQEIYFNSDIKQNGRIKKIKVQLKRMGKVQ